MAVIELVSCKSFPQLWRELRKLGWKAKKPTGLSDDYCYHPPNASLDGQEGRDFFTGEDALMKFARRRRLLRLDLKLTDAIVDAALADPFTLSRAGNANTPPATHGSPANSTAAPGGNATAPSASPIPLQASVSPSADAAGPPRRRRKTTLRIHERLGVDLVTLPRADRDPAPAQASGAQAVHTAPATAGDTATAESSTAQGEDTARSTAQDNTQPSDTAEEGTAVAHATAPATAEDDVMRFDSPNFLQAMQNEEYFGAVDSKDVNISTEPIEDEDDSEVEEENVVDMLFDTYSDDEAGGEVDGLDADTCDIDDDRDVLRDMSASGWTIFDENVSNTCLLDAASDYFDGAPRPTKSARAFADSPLGLFFYFLPKVLWKKMAEETNRYRAGSIDAMAAKRQRQQQARQAKDPNVRVQALQEIKDELAKWKPVQPHELVHFVALLLARALAPQRMSLARHWSVQEEGAVPRGTFGRFMSRKRFEDIARFMHFNNNADDTRLRDRAWKVRPVLQVVEKTFRRGFLLGKTISLDEGMVGSRHRLNPMRVYMAGKPTKWGTKFYMTCCAETAYCARVEICCRNEETDNTITRAVMRNVTKTLQGLPAKRLIVTDSYYSSVTLSQELLKRGFYHVGTYRMNRLGWPKDFSYNFTSRPKKIPRGTYRIAVNKTIPGMVAVSWCDSRSVQVIATGCSTKPTTVTRREKNGSVSDVVCPQLVVDYQTGMGGVDQHDQLRLQRYSIQKSVRMLKYYKAVFLGIVDMAIVNGYVVHRFEKRAQSQPVPTHAEYIMRLHQELLAVTKLDMATHPVAENLVAAPAQASDHTLTQTAEIYKGKLRQYLCKVCSALSDKKQRSAETPFYCETCGRDRGGSVWLCNKVRPGQTLTCSQIWHTNWKNGTLIPAELRGRIRFCKRKRVSTVEEQKDSEEEGSSAGE